MKNYIIIALFLLVGNRVLSAVETYTDRKEGLDLVVSATVPVMTVYDDKFYTMASGSPWQSSFTNFKVNNYIRLGINPQVAQTNDLNGNIAVKIKMWKWNATTNSFVTSIVTQTLALNYSSSNNTALVDEIATYVDQNAHKVEVYITAINGGASFDVNDVYLKSEIEVERYYNFDATAVAGLNLNYDVSTLHYEFDWSVKPGAEYYELEWVHISSVTATNNVFKTTAQLNYNYYLNSTRVIVKGNSYRIPKIFDEGYIVYRIRAIGLYGTNFDVREVGAWTNTNESGTVASHLAANVLAVTGEFDIQMNWSHQVSYGDNGERFESLSFVDGLGRERQSVTHNTETAQAVVSNVYYDQLGRPVITDLPTPVDGEQLVHYPNFNKVNGTNAPFMASNFNAPGSTDCNVLGAELSTTSGAGQYYSPSNGNTSNENGLIPDAEKFPYARVQYKNDFTGRVLKASGVGKDLKTGGGHETIFGYASVDQRELDRLFGAEAGYASHYQKMVTIDANGQVYVQYLDMAGRTIASGLAGNSPTSLDAIAGNGAVNVTTTLLPGNAQNVVNIPASASITFTEFIEQNSSYTFDYAFTPQQFQNACMGSTFCLDCEYDMGIKIIEECTGTVVYSNVQTLLGHDADNLCSAKTPVTLTTPGLALTVGEYTIIKTLSVNQQAMEDKWCSYIEQTSCDGTIATKFNQLYDLEAFEACVPEAPDNTAINGTCDDYKLAMLADLTPGGQYAQYTNSNGIYTPLSNVPTVHSVLTVGSMGINWNTAYPTLTYKNADGTEAFVGTLRPQQLSFQDFITNFQPSWAEALLPYHPEYCMYTFCTQNQASANYDNAMLSTYTYSAACSARYFKPLPNNSVPPIQPYTGCTTTNNYDPFFNTGGKGVTLQTTMNSEMANYNQTGYSMWQYAIYQVMCNGTGSITTCLANNTTIDVCYQDAIWIAFRNMYLNLKAQKVYQIQHAQPDNPTCSNAQIGVGTWTGKYAIFGNASALNNFDPDGSGPLTAIDYDIDGNGPDGGTVINQAYINSEITASCQTSCGEYADDWISRMSGCEQYTALSSTNKTNFRNSLITLCMSGCDSNHPYGSSTAPTGSSTPYPTIDAVMLAYFGAGFEDNLCTGLLISEPEPYQSTTAQYGLLTNPLDVCACTEILQAELDFYNDNRNHYSLEQIIAMNTGVTVEDANIMLCKCKSASTSSPFDQSNVQWVPNVNTFLANTGVVVPADLSCTNGNGCTDCTTINGHVATLNTRFVNLSTLSNYETILTNYLNRQLLYHLTYFDYQDFIDKCAATTTNPYCKVNPLMSEWSEVMTLLTFRGELLNTSSNVVNLLGYETPSNTPTNIVYANSDLKDKFLYDNYWSSQTSTTLTSYFGSTTLGNCSFTLTLPAGATFGFSDIVSFGVIDPQSMNCTNNYSFKVKVGYLDCGKVNYGWLTGTNTCLEVNQCICSATGLTLCDEKPEIKESACYQPRLNELYSDALANYLEKIDELYAAYKVEFNSACSAAFSTENLSFTGPKNEYQYTLYFYDQAGNLVKTVAPSGNNPTTFNTINVGTARDAVQNSTTPLATYNPAVYPPFTYETVYKYNSYNQLVSTTNPDQQGETKFWYDRYGRIVASQNPVQADEQKYSYSIYDTYGRPIEVGQADLNGVQSAISETTIKTDDNGTAFKTWVYGCVRSEVTFTKYDTQLNTTIAAKFANGMQENLRLRVASVFYFATVSGASMPQTGYESAVHYTYDIHGNVKEQLQDVPALVPVLQDIKSTQYDYELLSGNMKKVEYQKGKRDRMTHEYHYDKLYRLTEVFTSTDAGVHKSREAHYHYYDYGPLARVELGQHKVQGQDFAYTINGWIKGMNSTTLNETRDGGKDGIGTYNGINSRVHELVAKDVVGYTLGYFQNDYKSILASSFEANPYAFIPSTSTVNPYGTAISNLYNGNISHSETAIDGFEVLGSVYKYDQLQQLKSMRVFRSATLGADNSWASSVETTDYSSSYVYDKNGNLTSLIRKATTALGLNMDAFTYAYTTVAGNVSNRLDKVTDGAGTTASISDDIEPGQTNGNYTYDKLGQLINDVQTSGFATGTQTIFWRTGDKKIQSQLSQTRKLEYIYNPFGQRVLKIEKVCVGGVVQAQTAGTPWKYTYYGYDANGQVMSTYSVIMNTVSSNYTANIDELNIYGAGRIGLIESGKSVYNNNIALPTEGPIWINQLGNKRYELTNHLGNVNAVISDRKIPQSSSYVYTVNTFSSSTDGWTATTPATVTQSNNQLNVNTNASQNGAKKAFTTVIGQEYDVVINAIKGGAPNLEFYINGVSYPITSGVTTSITFPAITTSTTINVRATATGSYTFTVQDITLISHQKYTAVAIMKADYYPFGYAHPGRNTNTSAYRFGYNGMEKDPEIKGDGNSYTTEFRQYDPRLGRWLSLDPLMAELPSWSPYVAFENNPVLYTDPFGLKATGDKDKKPKKTKITEIKEVEEVQTFSRDFTYAPGVEGTYTVTKKYVVTETGEEEPYDPEKPYKMIKPKQDYKLKRGFHMGIWTYGGPSDKARPTWGITLIGCDFGNINKNIAGKNRTNGAVMVSNKHQETRYTIRAHRKNLRYLDKLNSKRDEDHQLKLSDIMDDAKYLNPSVFAPKFRIEFFVFKGKLFEGLFPNADHSGKNKRYKEALRIRMLHKAMHEMETQNCEEDDKKQSP